MAAEPNRVQELLREAVALDPADRETYLGRACANSDLRQRVEELLRGHDQLGQVLDASAADEADEPPAEFAGRYKMLKCIGEGGMGVVWMAEQRHPFRRHVAVKLVKPGMDTKAVLARFDAERQALALMDHPNIARVLDGGTTDDGRPYFVMELVKGVPVTDYCDDRQLTVTQRVELFARVCRAVEHAHLKGVVHRDLKPSNILVAEDDVGPLPKVIDFGLAKAFGDGAPLSEGTAVTSVGAVLGTPPYMAPEQVGVNLLDIDTRADVYALGVVLHELLTGTTPIPKGQLVGVSWDEVRRVICEEEPQQLVQGELGWVVTKAMAKDRNCRYATVAELAQDVSRYLAGKPVEAGPSRRLCRLRMLARRHRGAVLAAALVAGLAGTTWGLVRAEETRQQDAHEPAAKDAPRDTTSADPGTNPPPAADGLEDREVVRRLARTLEGRFADQPMVEESLLATVGTTFESPTFRREELPQLDRAFVLCRAQRGPDHPDTLSAMAHLVTVLGLAGDTDRARRLGEDCLARHTARYGEASRETLSARLRLANVLALTDRGRAWRELDTCAKAFQTAFGPTERRQAFAMYLGEGYLLAGRGNVARPHFATTATTFARVHGPDNVYAIAAGQLMAKASLHCGDARRAVTLLEENVPRLTRTRGPTNFRTLDAQATLAAAYTAVGSPKQAASVLEGCWPKFHDRNGDTPATLGLVRDLVWAYSDAGEHQKATDLAQTHVTRIRGWRPSQDGELAGMLTALGRALTKAGRAADAEPLLRECLDLGNRAQSETWVEAASQAVLGQCLAAQGKDADAERHLSEALAGLRGRGSYPLYPHVRRSRIAEADEALAGLSGKAGRDVTVTKLRPELDGFTANAANPAKK